MNLLMPGFSSPLKLVDDFFTEASRSVRAEAPACDVIENDKAIILKVDLPGFRKADIELQYKNGLLTISGQRPAEGEQADKSHVHLQERRLSTFKRSFVIKAIEDEAIKASYESGVLTVVLPKKSEPMPRKISILDGSHEVLASEKEESIN